MVLKVAKQESWQWPQKDNQMESLVHCVRKELRAQLSVGSRGGGLTGLGAEHSGNKFLALAYWGDRESWFLV